MSGRDDVPGPPGKGTMAARIRAYDWSTTPLGPMAAWPAELRVVVDLMLESRFPMALVWGPALTTLHNDPFLPILGDRDDALGRSFADVWSDVWSDVWDAVEPIARRALAGEATYIENFPLETTRSGAPERAFFTFCYSPVRDVRGQVVGFLDMVIETTDAVAAEDLIRRTNLDLETEIRHRTEERDVAWRFAQDVQVVLDGQGRIRSANPAWAAVLGWTREESVGWSLTDFEWVEEDAGHQPVLEGIRQSDLRPVEARMRHRDGGFRWLSWLATSQADFTYASGRDITLEKNAARELEAAQDQLRQAQKMEAFGQLTGGIAHDFNNLLQAVSGSLEMLGRKYVKEEGGYRYVKLADQALGRAAHLTRQLLAFARKQSLEVKALDTNEAVGTSMDLAARSLPENVQVERRLGAGTWPAMSDANQLDVAILNLVINARDAMPDGGLITVSTANVTAPGPGATADLVAGDYVKIAIADTGTGMSAETQGRVFEPFFTTKDVGKGTGLGLSQVYGFAHQSGGGVRIDSTLGAGTSVEIFLPRATLVDHTVAEAASPTAWRGRETVLVVDDDDDVRDLAVACLQEYGYRVLEARSGTDALEVIGREAAIDLLVIDYAMPRMNGAETVRLARRIRPDLEVLFITGYADLRALHEHVDAQAIVQKPFKLAQFADRVATSLARRANAVERST